MLKIVEEIERRLRDYYCMNKEASTSSQLVKTNVHLLCYSYQSKNMKVRFEELKFVLRLA